jgi:outer membrane protein assembly factor BamB
LIAVNRSGRELWRRNIENPLCAKVIIGWDGRLFVPTDGKIFCYTASGNLLWTRTLETSFLLAPKLDRSGGIIFALENNEVWRIDAFGNAHVWMLSNTPAVLLPIEQQQIMTLYTDGTIEILSSFEDWYIAAQSENHSLIWPRLPASPLAAIIRGNYAAAVMSDGRVVLVSLAEREILWSGDSHIREYIASGRRPEMEAEMLFDERGIFILSKNGATGFTHDGRRLWFTILQNAAAIPAFGQDGILYSGGRDWILYAYKIEERVLPEWYNLYGPPPEGNYGTGRLNSSFMHDFPINEHELLIKLEQMSSGINAGRVGANELVWKSTLMMIATSQFRLTHKLEAIQLLGQIGSRETIPWLINLFRWEIEPAKRTAAANAIGAIGVDPGGIAIQSFSFLIVNGGGIRDEQVLTAIASATGALSRFSGPPLSENGIRILNLLSANNQPSVVRRQANRELASLR